VYGVAQARRARRPRDVDTTRASFRGLALALRTARILRPRADRRRKVMPKLERSPCRASRRAAPRCTRIEKQWRLVAANAQRMSVRGLRETAADPVQADRPDGLLVVAYGVPPYRGFFRALLNTLAPDKTVLIMASYVKQIHFKS